MAGLNAKFRFEDAPVRRQGVEPILKRMAAWGALTASEQSRIDALATRMADIVSAGETLRREGDRDQRLRYVLSGWACVKRSMPDGRQQIFGLVLPGDPIGLSMEPCCYTSDVVALTPMRLVDAGPAVDAAADPSESEMLGTLSLATDARQGWLLEQVMRLGRLNARERTAHLLLEIHERLSEVGLVTGDSFKAPVTQETLGDILGLSIVHVNRVLQQLRRERLISMRNGHVTLIARDTLVALAAYKSPRERLAVRPREVAGDGGRPNER